MNLLAIDQGTSATKALVVSTERGTLAEAEVPVHPAAAPGGGVEQDPEELYRSVVEAGRRALDNRLLLQDDVGNEARRAKPELIEGKGVGSQRDDPDPIGDL